MIYLLTLMFPVLSYANFALPQNLTTADQQETMNIIGLGTSTKFLSNAYPLGGYAGLEVSASAESLNLKNVKNLGGGTDSSGSVIYPKLTVGKGLYNNSDVFLEFIPFNDTAKIARYGLMFRTSLYQADFFPINVSLLVHANSANINNQLFTRTLGGDILLGTMVRDISFTIAAGYVDTTGSFTSTVTSTQTRENASAYGIHLGMSAVYLLEPMMFGLAVDRYDFILAGGGTAVVSLKAGFFL